MPRKYELGKRAVQQAETRRRILDAAIELYLEQGVSATTMLDIARRADVAPGTVANHFGSAAALATEVTGTLLADLHMPTPDVFDGVEGLRDRIGLLVRELIRVLRAHRAVVARLPAGAATTASGPMRTARFYVDLDALVRAALGPLASDEEAVAVVDHGARQMGARRTPGDRSKRRDSSRARVGAPCVVARNASDAGLNRAHQRRQRSSTARRAPNATRTAPITSRGSSRPASGRRRTRSPRSRGRS